MIYVGDLVGEHGGTAPLHWCGACGTIRYGFAPHAMVQVPAIALPTAAVHKQAKVH